jgi:zinc transporter ZupT
MWLSIAGGVSVAYVFVHLLPELAETQEVVAEAAGEVFAFVERHVYLVALLGLAVFYGLERAARQSRERGPGREEAAAAPGIFLLHVLSFSVYNAIIGYLLLHREGGGMQELSFFALAMALHFLVNDFGLREHHREAYDRLGRWVLAGAVLLGWVVGLFAEISEAALGVLIAFLAGGVILNVLKEELPEERRSRFWAFACGAGLYAVLLLTF